jgi:hypothetical protein
MKSTRLDWNAVKQLTLPQTLAVVFMPSAVRFAGFHLLLPVLVRKGVPVLLA